MLSFLIFFNSIGYIVLYVERLADNKKEMFTLINSVRDLSDIHKLKFTQYEYTRRLNWKDDNEFEFEGKMYDIVKIEMDKDEVIVYCIWDKREDELISIYEKHCRNNSAKDKIHSSQNSTNTSNLLAIQYEFPTPGRIDYVIFLSEKCTNNYHSVFKDSLTPPPKIV